MKGKSSILSRIGNRARMRNDAVFAAHRKIVQVGVPMKSEPRKPKTKPVVQRRSQQVINLGKPDATFVAKPATSISFVFSTRRSANGVLDRIISSASGGIDGAGELIGGLDTVNFGRKYASGKRQGCNRTIGAVAGDFAYELTDAFVAAQKRDDDWDDDWYYMDYQDDGDDEDDDIYDVGDGTNIDCINCPGCENCEGCVNCVNCKNCKNCKNCVGCNGCEDCQNCIDSSKCSSCSKCSKCKKCTSCKSCKKCTSCNKGCSKCSNCSKCSGCSRCSKCSGGCSKCSKCSGCSGCSKCSNCSGCSNCSNTSNGDNASNVQGVADAVDSAITALENCQDIMDSISDMLGEDGMADMMSMMDSILDSSSEAMDMLSAMLDQAMNLSVSDMMESIVTAIEDASSTLLPLFNDIFSMTWSENKEWFPTSMFSDAAQGIFGQICNGVGSIGEIVSNVSSNWMCIKDEIPEYFNYIQEFINSSCASCPTSYYDMFGFADSIDSLIDAVSQVGLSGCGMSIGLGQMGLFAGVPNAIGVGIGQQSNMDVPLMSIAKQVMDLMNKVCKLNTDIRCCAKNLRNQLKKLESSDLKSCCKRGCCGGSCNKKKNNQVQCQECKATINVCKDYYWVTKEDYYICEKCHEEYPYKYDYVEHRDVQSRADGGDYGDYESDWDTEEEWDEELDSVYTDWFDETLDSLLESEFILSNLAIAMGKIMEFYLNKYTGKFSVLADNLLMKIMNIWGDVIEIVPPLDDLLKVAKAIPNDADQCNNCAMNQSIQQIWPLVQKYVAPSMNCIDNISNKCDFTNTLQFPGESMDVGTALA